MLHLEAAVYEPASLEAAEHELRAQREEESSEFRKSLSNFLDYFAIYDSV